MQIKFLEEENADLRETMARMRQRMLDTSEVSREWVRHVLSLSSCRDERDRNDDVQQLIARAERHARRYMASLPRPSTLVRLMPLSSSRTSMST